MERWREALNFCIKTYNQLNLICLMNLITLSFSVLLPSSVWNMGGSFAWGDLKRSETSITASSICLWELARGESSESDTGNSRDQACQNFQFNCDSYLICYQNLKKSIRQACHDVINIIRPFGKIYSKPKIFPVGAKCLINGSFWHGRWQPSAIHAVTDRHPRYADLAWHWEGLVTAAVHDSVTPATQTSLSIIYFNPLI